MNDYHQNTIININIIMFLNVVNGVRGEPNSNLANVSPSFLCFCAEYCDQVIIFMG